MKISYNWLKDYIKTDLSPEKISELLTSGGLEVEDIEQYESIKGGLEGVVVGQVVECNRHPNADKLSLTKVDLGKNQIVSIVCGAPNVAEGQKVLVATLGTTLYSGNDSFTIKQSKIRGELSEGMICAEDELGLGSSHDGIIVLPEDTEVGILAKDYFNITKDYIFEIGLTPNRSDATSHIGVARDLVALINQHLHSDLSISLPDVSAYHTENHDLPIVIEVENPAFCPRYAGITMKNIKVVESPDWLKSKLLSIGLRPINSVVDVTNFVLMEMGQPLHAFDYSKITGKKIVVKKLNQNYPFTTLDEVERKLQFDDLMICNETEPMCIGGVYGGLNSGVNEQTCDIFIESAYFDPATIRKTSKYHNLKTDAAFRFERGTDPNMVVYALKRAALLIKEISGGSISSDIIDIYPTKIHNCKIELNINRINKFIGQTIDKNTILSILKSLGIIISNDIGEVVEVEIPTFKVDVTREADVIEEILRIYGYDNIHMDSKLSISLNQNPKPDKHKVQQLASEFLSANGYIEMMNNSLSKRNYYQESQYFSDEKSVKILNPLSTELDVMRQSLLFEGLDSIKRNQNYKSYDLKLYEFGKHYQLTSQNLGEIEKTFSEENHLALLITGNDIPEIWKFKQQKSNFYTIKSIFELLLVKLNLNVENYIQSETESLIYEYGLSYSKNNKIVCQLGKLSKTTLQQLEIKTDVFYADINWDLIISEIKQNKIIYKEISNYPEVRRDLALLVDKSVSFNQIKQVALKNEKSILKNISLFDIYQGEQIDKSKKSYAISFTLQDENKTLTDKQIDKSMQRITDALKAETGALLR